MTNTTRLSPNMLATLRSLANGRGCPPGTRSARAWWGGFDALCRRGLAERRDGDFRTLYLLTDAGRAALAETAS